MTEARKLAATLAADAVGYSRLMGADEEGTLARLRQIALGLTRRPVAALDERGDAVHSPS